MSFATRSNSAPTQEGPWKARVQATTTDLSSTMALRDSSHKIAVGTEQGFIYMRGMPLGTYFNALEPLSYD